MDQKMLAALSKVADTLKNMSDAEFEAEMLSHSSGEVELAFECETILRSHIFLSKIRLTGSSNSYSREHISYDSKRIFAANDDSYYLAA